MGISLRHHVLSLVAIFMMLLVGLLLGVGLTSKPEFVEQMDELRTRFTDDVLTLEHSQKTQEAFAREVLPVLVKGRLSGKRIVVIVTSRPEDNGSLSEVTEALETAGATVPYRVICRKDFIERAKSKLESVPAGMQASHAAAQRLGEAVADSSASRLKSLDKQGLVRLRGDVPRRAPSAVVVLGGAREGAQSATESIDRPLVEALQAAGVASIAGGEDSADISYMEDYRELGLSTVDNVDLARGQVSLVMALSGHPGNYGDGPSAEKEFAPLE